MRILIADERAPVRRWRREWSEQPGRLQLSMVALGLCGLACLAVSGSLIGWRLDRTLREEIARLRSRRAVRVVAIAPALAGPYRIGGAATGRVDETNAAVARLQRQRRLVRYVLGLPLVALALMITWVTDGATLELLWAAWTDDELRRGPRRPYEE